jgi:hypothetical protein
LASCLRPGDLLVFLGQGLGSPDPRYEREVFLVEGANRVPLVLQQRSANQIMARLPLEAALTPGRGYRLLLQYGPNFRNFVELGEPLRPCAAGQAPAATGGTAGGSPEVLATFRIRGTPELGALFGGSPEALIAELGQRGLQLLERRDLDGLGMVMLRLSPPATPPLPALLDELRAAYPAVSFDLNSRLEASQGRRYGASMIGLKDEQGCRLPPGFLKLGILDSAVDWRHPALAGASHIESTSFLMEGEKPADHGTAIAALLLGAPDSGFPGLLQGQALAAAAVLEETPQGLAGSLDALLSGLDWLALRKVELAVMALEGPPNQALETGLLAAADGGMVMVAAAGNGGPDSPVAFPGASRWVFAVTALDAEGAVYPRATRGPEIAFAAPGVDIWSAKAGGQGAYASGTSFAAPFLAAALAPQLLAAPPNQKKGLSAIELRQQLRDGLAAQARDLGEKGRDDVFGWGLPRASGCL